VTSNVGSVAPNADSDVPLLTAIVRELHVAERDAREAGWWTLAIRDHRRPPIAPTKLVGSVDITVKALIEGTQRLKTMSHLNPSILPNDDPIISFR
jgi:hypothetical protein